MSSRRILVGENSEGGFAVSIGLRVANLEDLFHDCLRRSWGLLFEERNYVEEKEISGSKGSVCGKFT